MIPTDAQVEQEIREAFEKNYEQLRLESSHTLAPAVREAALQQVLLYWKKLRGIAVSITDTEVKLNLPFQESPQGRPFGIEGVVDLVQAEGKTTMYDIKTHDAEYVRSNVAMYAEQLNVYAYVWEHLRGQRLDETAIIVTTFPESLRNALLTGPASLIASELDAWEPVISIQFSHEHVRHTIEDFGKIVDRIEDVDFGPADITQLKTVFAGTHSRFGTRVCRNCDARFSCKSYRNYALGSRGNIEARFSQYFNDFGDDVDREEWFNAALEGSTEADQM